MAVYSVCKLDDIEGSYAGGLAASSATLPDVAPLLRTRRGADEAQALDHDVHGSRDDDRPPESSL